MVSWRVAISTSALSVGVIGVLAATPTSAALSHDRLGGSDRYATSALVSVETFPDGADTVFLGSGEDYPDALVGGAVGGHLQAPVLLTKPESIPDVIEVELERLDPSVIVILGGESAVSPEVAEAAADYGEVERLGGATRYETALLVAESGFDAGARVAYLASGEDFPDALAGGVAAALDDAPVLLTHPDVLSPEVATYLADLAPERIVLLGGVEAVSESVASAAALIAPVSRLAGADRFATSAAISAATFTDASTVFLADGMTFPDALSGTPLAAANDAPILLVKGDSASPQVCAEVRRLTPDRVVGLGGPAAVSDAVLSQVVAECTQAVLPLPKPGPTNTIGPPPAPAASGS